MTSNNEALRSREELPKKCNTLNGRLLKGKNGLAFCRSFFTTERDLFLIVGFRSNSLECVKGYP